MKIEQEERLAIAEFFKKLVDKSAALAWIFDAEFKRTMDTKRPVPVNARTELEAADPEHKFIGRDERLTPSEAVEEVGAIVIKYKESKKLATLNLDKLDRFVNRGILESSQAEEIRKYQDRTERRDEKVKELIADIGPDRFHEIMGFLFTYRRKPEVLAWLKDHEGVRTAAEKIDEKIHDLLTAGDELFEFLESDPKLTPLNDTEKVIDAVVIVNARGKLCQISYNKSSTKLPDGGDSRRCGRA